eukprot:365783-Chlamydomonas_euryale.AAC.2
MQGHQGAHQPGRPGGKHPVPVHPRSARGHPKGALTGCHRHEVPIDTGCHRHAVPTYTLCQPTRGANLETTMTLPPIPHLSTRLSARPGCYHANGARVTPHTYRTPPSLFTSQ